MDAPNQNRMHGLMRGGLVMAPMDWLLRHRRTKVAATDRLISNDAGACPLLYRSFRISRFTFHVSRLIVYTQGTIQVRGKDGV